MEKKIIHVDMDYFFAQVEIRDNPTLKGLPVAIGSERSRRGVLSTCNYIARGYGVRSAMPTYKALELCPKLILVGSNFQKYKKISGEIFSIFYEYTDKVEVVSIDEAYLDVTDCTLFSNSATLIAQDILNNIYEKFGLTASAGVSYNKLLAKIASEKLKPNGLYVIAPNTKKDFIRSLNIKNINGVGKVMGEKFSKNNIHTFGDLQKYTKLDLINTYGRFGHSLFHYCRGEDFRVLETIKQRKSLSVERTFETNIENTNDLSLKLVDCYEEMIRRLENHTDRLIKTICIKVKFANFSQTTIEQPISELTFKTFNELLLANTEKIFEPVRLIGLGVKFYDKNNADQLPLPIC